MLGLIELSGGFLTNLPKSTLLWNTFPQPTGNDMEAEKERKGDSDYIQITSWPIQLFDKQIKHLYPPPDLSLAHLIRFGIFMFKKI